MPAEVSQVEAQNPSEEVQVRLLVVRPEDEPSETPEDYCVSLTFFPQTPSNVWRWEFHTALESALGPRRASPHWLGPSRVVFRCRLDELVHVSKALDAANRVHREYRAETRGPSEEWLRVCG